MKIIEYFSTENKEYWLSKIFESDWGAANYLHYLIKENKLFELVGDNTRVFMLIDEENLISFCTLANLDDVQPTDLTPWIGWIYTFPSHRGKRLAGELLSYVENIAKQEGAIYTHISTNHIGLYEKYGYEFYTNALDVEGEKTRVYRKAL